MQWKSAHKWQLMALVVFLLVAATVCVTGVGAGSSQSSIAKRMGRHVGEVPAAAKPEAFQGYLAASETMHMIISFELRDPAGMEKLKGDLYNPGSALYRHWLTPKEFGNRFGRTQDEFNQAINWLKGQGFVVDTAFDNRLAIAFTGSVDTVQHAFGVQMGQYWDATNNRSFYSNLQPATLPRQIDAITVGLEGLNDAILYHRQLLKTRPVYPQATTGKAPREKRTQPAGVPGAPDFMAPADLARYYDFQPFFDNDLLGQGQRVGIVIDSDVEDSDVAMYRSFFDLPAADIERLLPGKLKSPGVQPNGGQGEATLDVSCISLAAPLAEIDLILVPSLSFANTALAEQAIVNDGSIHVVNESFGACEAEGFSLGEQNTFAQAVTEGIAFFASAGDEGVECGNAFLGVKQIQCPACYSEVTAVGGTQIQAAFNQATGALVSVESEDVWNSPPGDKDDCTSGGSEAFPAGGTGGGVSQIIGIPPYQAGAQGFFGGVPAGTNRVVPDVAALAGVPFTVAFLGGKEFDFIGTSAASPMWAGMTALVNQFAGEPIGSPNPLIYRLGIAQYNANVVGSFHDITVGNNTVLPRPPCDPGVAGYSAQFGYDPVTGWGSPDLTGLVNNALALVPPVINSLSAELAGSVLTFSGAATDPKGNIAEADIILLDGTGAVVGSTGAFAVTFGSETSVSLDGLGVSNMGNFPTALTAGLFLIDSQGNESVVAIANFSQADPGGADITSVALNSANGPLVIKGTGFSSPIQLEVNGVIVGPPVPVKIKAAGSKLKITASEVALNLNSGPNRIRVLVNGLNSNIFVLTL
jgi:kumamolisin